MRLGFLGPVPGIFLSFFRVRGWGKFASMIANSVRLTEVLRQMEEGEGTFSIRFVTADVKRQTGGKIEEWPNCRLSHRRAVLGERPRPVRPADSESRLPNHYQNATRNLVQGNSSQVRTVHIWLILAFNGQKVVLG